jgi:hypothetical protein
VVMSFSALRWWRACKLLWEWIVALNSVVGVWTVRRQWRAGRAKPRWIIWGKCYVSPIIQILPFASNAQIEIILPKYLIFDFFFTSDKIRGGWGTYLDSSLCFFFLE